MELNFPMKTVFEICNISVNSKIKGKGRKKVSGNKSGLI